MCLEWFPQAWKRNWKSWKLEDESGHPDDSIVESSQNTHKSHGDMRKLTVTQTPVKDHQLTLLWSMIIIIHKSKNQIITEIRFVWFLYLLSIIIFGLNSVNFKTESEAFCNVFVTWSHTWVIEKPLVILIWGMSVE